MSKLETVKALGASSQQQLQIVQTIQQLQQQIGRMQQELASLPEAVASETSQALSGLATLRQDVRQVLTAYDQVTTHQRQALDSLTEEMTTKAAASFESKTEALGQKTQDLSISIKQMVSTAQQIDSLPARLSTATSSLETASESLTRAAYSLLPPLWKRLATMTAVAMLAGAIGSLAAATGHRVSEQLVPPSAEQKELASFRALWRKATKEERELMQQIANRPAN